MAVKLLTQPEVAERLGLSVRQVRRMYLPVVRLPSANPGGRPTIRYPEDLLDQYVRQYVHRGPLPQE